MAWGGVPLNARTAAMMDEAQTLYGATITATQGSPSVSVSASGTTHAGEGAIDVAGADLDAIVIAMRQVGFAAWHRTPAQGFVHHVHGVAVGEPGLSSTAAQQVQAYYAGRNGLANNSADDGPRDWVGITWETYTGGTYVPPPGGGVPVRIYDQYPGDRSGVYWETAAYLTGTPTYTGDRRFDVNALDTSTEDSTLTLNAGDSLAVELFQDWSYDIPTGLTRGMWLIQSTGGTLTAETGFDLGWSYPSYTTTWTPSPLSGEGPDDFTAYDFPTELLDADHLYDIGAPLLKITCTSGTAVITWAGMRIEQPQGLYLPDGGGEWSSSYAPSTVKGGGYGTFDYYLVGSDSFWTVDDTEVMAIEPQTFTHGTGNYFDPVNIGADGALAAIDDALSNMVTSAGSGSSVTADFNASPNGGFGFFPPGWSWHASITEHNAQWTAPSRCAPLAYPDGYFGLEDWQAIDYEWLDDDWGFLGWILFDTYAGTSDECTWALRQFVIADGAYGAYVLHAGSASSSGSTAPTTTPIAGYPPDVLDDPGTVPLSYAEVTTSDRLYYMKVTVTPTVPGTSAGELRATRISDSTDIAVSPVTALFRVPGYRLKIPTYVAAPTPAPFITDPEDRQVTYLRNKQRNDGLGNWSQGRGRSRSSQQRSIRGRGYR